jgi:hypothetical protein
MPFAMTGSIIAGGKQAGATKKAAQLQATSAANSLAFNKQVFDTTQTNEQPFLKAGQGAVNTLATDLAPGGSLTKTWDTPFTFSGVNETNDPEYQFDLQQGEQAQERSAAATGGLISGGEQKDLINYAQGNSLNAFNSSYANALTNYNTAMNAFETNQSNTYSRLAGLAGIGQGAQQTVATAGSNAANTNASTSTTSAANEGNFIAQGGSAQAAGIMGATNALSNTTNNAINSLAESSGSSYAWGG